MYDEIPGKAGAILRTAAKCGLEIKAHGGEPQAWTIYGSLRLNDAIYVYWTPTKRHSGVTGIYRPGRRKGTAIVKMTGSEAQAWVLSRRKD